MHALIRTAFLLLAATVASTTTCAAGDAVFADGFDPPGVLLVGPADGLAIDAIQDMPPRPAPAGDVEDGLILTRMDVYIDRQATVGQVNEALIANDARIVAMAPDHPLLTLVIPRASGKPALQKLRDTFKASPGILLATMPYVPASEIVPDPPVADPASLAYLHASRFPAAWNLRQLATRDCATRRVPLRVIDHFNVLPADLQAVFDDQIPEYQFYGEGSPTATTHGYDVTLTAAARFDAASQIGANPFPECLKVIDMNADAMTWGEIALWAGSGDQTSNVVDNFSLGDWLPCDTDCSPANFNPSIAVDLASKALAWRSDTRAWDSHSLFVIAAGNEGDSTAASLYPFFGLADFASPAALAASPELFGNVDNSTDDDLAFLGDASFLDSAVAGYPSMRAGADDLARLRRFAAQNLSSPVGTAPNTLIVGSTTNQDDPSQLQVSTFSRRSAMVEAVGEQIPTLVGPGHRGTSYATPQVSGLASYLWLLSEPLRHATVDQTVEAITANADVGPRGTLLIDAYASVLSLDAADANALVPSAETMPMRLALLDVDGDGRFTESDLSTIQEQLLLEGGVLQDWSRYDLNGDGYTGGFHASRFDLDRVGSVQFSGARYSTVTETIEGRTAYFFEPALLDSEILCYYAYSPLYTGDTTARTSLLGDTCANPAGTANEFSFGIGGANPVQTVYGGGRAFTVGQPFGSPARVAEFDFASGGWGTPQILSDDWQLTPFAMAANRGGQGGIIALERLITYEPDALYVTRFDGASDSWRPIETLDVSAYPINPELLNDSVAVGVSASGSALVVWKTGSQPWDHWQLAAALFDATTGEWTDPMPVSDAAFPNDGTYTKEILADDDGENFYVNIFGSAQATFRLQAKTRTWAEVEPYPGYSWHMGIDRAGRVLGMGSSGASPDQVIASHYDPATDHWSTPVVVYTVAGSGAFQRNIPDEVTNANYAYQGDGSEACHFNFCVAANGDAVLVSAVDASATSALRVSYYLAEIDQWVNRGIVQATPGFSVAMGYYTGNVDIAWYDGKIFTQHLDRLNGLGSAQEIFDGSGWSWVYPPIVAHDDGDAAVAIWGARASNQLMHDLWRPLH